MSWLVSTLTRTSSKGTISNVNSTDTVTTTNNRGARSTTGETTVTTTEDAGGSVTFSVPIRGGMFATGAPPVCPAP